MDDKCYESTHQYGRMPKWIVLALLSVFLLTAVLVLVSTTMALVYAIAAETFGIGSLLTTLLYMLVAALILRAGWALCCRGFARYRFEMDGLLVKYPLQKAVLIPWSSFQQVCVCDGSSVPKGMKTAAVLCCVRHGEKKNLYDRWKTDSIFRYRSVICMDYTPELHRGLQERCPLPVVDLRDTAAYRC